MSKVLLWCNRACCRSVMAPPRPAPTGGGQLICILAEVVVALQLMRHGQCHTRQLRDDTPMSNGNPSMQSAAAALPPPAASLLCLLLPRQAHCPIFARALEQFWTSLSPLYLQTAWVACWPRCLAAFQTRSERQAP